jgi:hypothetical protein
MEDPVARKGAQERMLILLGEFLVPGQERSLSDDLVEQADDLRGIRLWRSGETPRPEGIPIVPNGRFLARNATFFLECLGPL